MAGSVLLVLALTAAPAHAAPPGNDDFGGTVTIVALPYTATLDTTEATRGADDPSCLSGRTVWYAFTPAEDIGIAIDASASSFLPLVGVFSGPTDVLYCDYPYPRPTTLPLTGGTTVYIGIGGAGGTLSFSITQLPRPANDDFAAAEVVQTLPFSATVETAAATRDPEQSPGCSGVPRSVWYRFTPESDMKVTATTAHGVAEAFTGGSVASLTVLRCSQPGVPLTVSLLAGTTYSFSVSGGIGGIYEVTFDLDPAPPPIPDINYYPWDPSPFAQVSFSSDASQDPGGMQIVSSYWNFGDGSNATGSLVYHTFPADTDYTVRLTVTTSDGRTGTATEIVQVRTHDVATRKIAVPKAANVGATKTISVWVSSRYDEPIWVSISRSGVAGYEYQDTCSLVTVPPGQLAKCDFTYTFTAADASAGKIRFKAEAVPQNHTDPLPSDNTLISPEIKVTGKR